MVIQSNRIESYEWQHIVGNNLVLNTDFYVLQLISSRGKYSEGKPKTKSEFWFENVVEQVFMQFLAKISLIQTKSWFCACDIQRFHSTLSLLDTKHGRAGSELLSEGSLHSGSGSDESFESSAHVSSWERVEKTREIFCCLSPSFMIKQIKPLAKSYITAACLIEHCIFTYNSFQNEV